MITNEDENKNESRQNNGSSYSKRKSVTLNEIPFLYVLATCEFHSKKCKKILTKTEKSSKFSPAEISQSIIARRRPNIARTRVQSHN